MRVLVTGHNGYIGTILTPMLTAEGFEVVGLDTNWFADCRFGWEPPEVETIQKDYRDVEVHDFKGFDSVIHLANLSNDPLGDLYEDLTYDINHLASIRVAVLARQAGVRRFVFSSSCSTYGAGAGDDFLDENAEFNPVTAYGECKVRMERDLHQLADDVFSPVSLRNATAYGVSPRLRMDIVLNNLVGWAMTTGKVVLLSDGTPWRPIVHIEDISRAFVSVLKAPRDTIHNRAFNVGRTDSNYRILELAQIVAETVPGCEIEIAEGAGPDKRSYRVDCSRIENELPGFEAKWDARSGAKELYDAFREYGMDEAMFQGPLFVRLKHLQSMIDSKRMTTDLRWRR